MERSKMENVDTVIGINVNLKGNLKNKGSIQVNGSVEGEVRSDENVKQANCQPTTYQLIPTT